MSEDQYINIIILNWNGSGDTLECLQSLSKVTYKYFRIILIDNGSDDDSVSILNHYIDTQDEEVKKTISFIQVKENLGFAKGCNFGMRYAQEKGYGSKVLLLNNDTVVTPDFLSNLSEFHDKHPEYSAVSPVIKLFYDKKTIWNCGGKIVNGYKKYYYQNAPDSSIKEKEYLGVSFLTGCALLFDFQRCGFLTERFFYGEEDFEFGLRLQSKGERMACVINSVIYHKVGRSISKSKSRGNAIAINHIHYLNRLIDYRSYCTSRTYYSIWLIRNMADLYFYLRKSEKLNCIGRIKVINDIISDSRKYDSVDKDLFTGIKKRYNS